MSVGAFYPAVSWMPCSPPASARTTFDRLQAAWPSTRMEKQLRYSSDEELGKASPVRLRCSSGTPYAHLDLGTVEGLNAITVDDVKKFYERPLHPGERGGGPGRCLR